MKTLLAVIFLLLPVVSPARSLLSGGDGVVEIDQDLLVEVLAEQIQQFSLPVDGRDLLVTVEEVSGPNLGVSSLAGKFEGREDSFFLLCRTESGAAVAFFQPGDGTAYRMDHTRGRDEVYPVDYEKLGGCGGGLKSESIRTGEESGKRTQDLPGPAGVKSGPVADDGDRHDILIGYTPAAETVMGGWDYIRAEAQLAVDAANLTYINSGIASYLRLVHVMPTDYEEISAWIYRDHVDYLWYPNDGHMDEVLVMRDHVGADFVSMLIDGRDFLGDVPTCGIAYIMQPDEISWDFEDLALSVVSVQCATGNWTLAHEVAHNRGCAHNREDATVDGAYPYSYGRRFVGSDDGWYRTVLAYDHFQGGYERIPYFTNPDVDFAGVPTGVSPGLQGEAHNALTHDNTAPACASFRSERTFVQFGWVEFSNGLLLFPFPDIAQAISNSRENGTIVIQNGDPGFVGSFIEPRSYVHDGTGSAVLGGN